VRELAPAFEDDGRGKDQGKAGDNLKMNCSEICVGGMCLRPVSISPPKAGASSRTPIQSFRIQILRALDELVEPDIDMHPHPIKIYDMKAGFTVLSLLLLFSLSVQAVQKVLIVPGKNVPVLLQKEKENLNQALADVNRRFARGMEEYHDEELDSKIKKMKPLIEEKATIQNRMQALGMLEKESERQDPAEGLKDLRLYLNPPPRGKPFEYRGKLYYFVPLEK
jgi:hypothetical protein